jgi:hypothetical protein
MSATTSPGRAPVRVILAGCIGSALEWYDFFLYGTAAALIAIFAVVPSAIIAVAIWCGPETYEEDITIDNTVAAPSPGIAFAAKA